MIIRRLGLIDWDDSNTAMARLSAERGTDSPDQLWLCEHPPVYTIGLAGRAEHLLAPGDIPVRSSIRGGQVTYHGPGQVVAYPLVDLRRLGLYVRDYVHQLEEALIRTLRDFGVSGHRVRGAPGVYVRPDDPGSHAMLAPTPAGAAPDFSGLAKVAALGIKVSRHCSTHGLALNVAMDLEPFGRINPCGYAGLAVTDLRQLGVERGVDEVGDRLAARLAGVLQAP